MILKLETNYDSKLWMDRKIINFTHSFAAARRKRLKNMGLMSCETINENAVHEKRIVKV